MIDMAVVESSISFMIYRYNPADGSIPEFVIKFRALTTLGCS